MNRTYFLQGWRLTGYFVLAAACVMGQARSMAADTLVSGFDGDLSSSLGVNWEVFGPNWSTEFTPQLSQGTGALKVHHNTNWQVGLKLAGGEALAQLVAANDTLELDAIGAFGMAWRQVFVVLNGNNEHVGWQQTEEFALTVPSEAEPFNHFVIDLTDGNRNAAGAQDWKAKAQAWLAAPAGDTKTYFELFIGFQGGSNAPTADFNFDTFVDGQDFLIWQQNFGNMEAGPEQGDTNFDAIVDGVDLAAWSGEFGSPVVSTIDNIVFKKNAISAVPEPSLAVGGIVAALAIAARCRRRS
ncbi:hypothetical protein [Lacipirellula limnantheis]|uniref:PEP-CTERM protein-sorting domain-containing protein n=1 Tax=Lacipirellula limnantheis TaxID=2528024 RepID=A0A517U1W9_9BACT|nr:hypothetical protein [Lacipirellula limnantheis]QDT74617.1 hypothetical protein I41_38140 [Lacipirellula limnantheis]